MKYITFSPEFQSPRVEPTGSQQTRHPSLKSRFQQFWLWLRSNLLSSDEPRVWFTRDRAGQTWWHGDDPVTGRSINYVTETEMRVWIEQRHYPQGQE